MIGTPAFVLALIVFVGACIGVVGAVIIGWASDLSDVESERWSGQ